MRETQHTGLALTEEEETEDFLFLVGELLGLDGSVDRERDLACALLVGDAGCTGGGRFVLWGTEEDVEGVVLLRTLPGVACAQQRGHRWREWGREESKGGRLRERERRSSWAWA